LWGYLQSIFQKISQLPLVDVILVLFNFTGKYNNKVWTLEITLICCVPQVFKCKYIVTWCIDKFVQNRRTIPLQSGSPVSLAPSIFKKMLKLPEPKLTYKGEEARNFLRRKNNVIELLQEYLQDPAAMP
jgi:hypothetical protein